jgi:hypothetical protein
VTFSGVSAGEVRLAQLRTNAVAVGCARAGSPQAQATRLISRSSEKVTRRSSSSKQLPAPIRLGWERASAPYIPTATSPGACNKGSTKEACYETDLHVAQAMGRLGESLSHVSVPAAYKTANAEMLQAMRIHLHGLSLRMHSLEAGHYTEAERDGWFTESKALIAESDELGQKAYQSFPQWARPNPAPTI